MVDIVDLVDRSGQGGLKAFKGSGACYIFHGISLTCGECSR